jgi:hypothetical protein
VCLALFVRLDQAFCKPLIQGGTIKVASDEDQLVAPRLHTPGTVGTSIKEHVNSLKDKAIRFVLETDNALHAEDIGALCLQEMTQPLVEATLVQISDNIDADRRNFFIVFVIGLEQLLNPRSLATRLT